MKKISKLVLGVVAISLLVVGVQKGIKYYLQGPAREFNSILISGELENVNKGKEIYKDNTKYTKDYKYRIVTNTEKMLDEKGNVEIGEDGKEISVESKFLVITKDTAKEMLKEQVLRTLKNPGSGSIETVVLESIPNIDTDKTIYFGDENKDKKLEINRKNIPLEYGSYSWLGYYPSEQGSLIVTDDETYKSIEDKEQIMSLIRFDKGKKDLRNTKDKEEIKEKLSKVQITEINYVNVEK